MFIWGNWKQWKWKLETENGKREQSKLDAMDLRVKPLIKDDHLCTKTT